MPRKKAKKKYNWVEVKSVRKIKGIKYKELPLFSVDVMKQGVSRPIGRYKVRKKLKKVRRLKGRTIFVLDGYRITPSGRKKHIIEDRIDINTKIPLEKIFKKKVYGGIWRHLRDGFNTENTPQLQKKFKLLKGKLIIKCSIVNSKKIKKYA